MFACFLILDYFNTNHNTKLTLISTVANTDGAFLNHEIVQRDEKSINQ